MRQANDAEQGENNDNNNATFARQQRDELSKRLLMPTQTLCCWTNDKTVGFVLHLARVRVRS